MKLALGSLKTIRWRRYNHPRHNLTCADLDALTGVGKPFVVGEILTRGIFLGRIFMVWVHYIGTPAVVHTGLFTLMTTFRCVPDRNPSLLDIFWLNSQTNFDCLISDDFNGNHRPVFLTTSWDGFAQLIGRCIKNLKKNLIRVHPFQIPMMLIGVFGS